MPEMNGYEATAAIRAQEGSDRHTPDHRHDRRRASGRPRALPGRGHGQLSRQADQQGCPARPGGPLREERPRPSRPAVRASATRQRWRSRSIRPSSTSCALLGEAVEQDFARRARRSVRPRNRTAARPAPRSARGRRRPHGRAHRPQHQGELRPAGRSSPRLVSAAGWRAKRPPGACPTARTICARSRSTTRICAAR